MLIIYILYLYFSYYLVLSNSAFKTFLRTRVESHCIEIKETDDFTLKQQKKIESSGKKN